MRQKGGDPESPAGGEDSLFLRVSKYVAIGLEFPSMVIGGIVVGYLLDRYFDTSPWFAISLLLLSFVGACIRLVQWARWFSGGKQ